MESKSLVTYIEKIRYGRNISQEKMLDGIISIRQYRRYLYGEVEIPFGVFAQLANRINVSPKNLFLEYEELRNKEKNLILDYYNAVISYDNERIEKLASMIEEDKIVDQDQWVFLISAKTIHQYNLGKLTKAKVAEVHKKLIDYPEVLSNTILTDKEMYILGTISQYDLSTRDDIMSKLMKIFKNDEYLVSGDNVVTYTQVLFWLAKYNGSLKQFDKTIEYCDLAIKYNHEFQSKYHFAHFFYYKALSYFRTNRYGLYRESLYNTILALELDNSVTRREHFYQIIKKDLNINPLVFMRDYINQNKLK